MSTGAGQALRSATQASYAEDDMKYKDQLGLITSLYMKAA